MRVTARVSLGVGLFVLAAGLVYWFTAYERVGAVMLWVLAVGFLYIAVVARGAAGAADESEAAPSPLVEGEEEVVAPTIWPFGFSLAAIGLVLGVVVQRWLLVVGGLLFILAASGWYRDIRRQHAHHH